MKKALSKFLGNIHKPASGRFVNVPRNIGVNGHLQIGAKLFSCPNSYDNCSFRLGTANSGSLMCFQKTCKMITCGGSFLLIQLLYVPRNVCMQLTAPTLLYVLKSHENKKDLNIHSRLLEVQTRCLILCSCFLILR